MAEGWSLIRERFPEFDITFFGAIKAEIPRLVVENGELVAKRANGREWLKMTSGRESISGDFDRYVVLGLGFGSNFFLQMLRSHRVKGLASKAPLLMSRSFMYAGADGIADASPAAITVRNLQQITSAPIAVLPCPHISASAKELPALSVFNNEGVVSLALELYQRQFGRLGWTIVEQPACTLDGPAFTRAEFTRGANHFLPDQTLKGHDFNHMNGEFGALYLEEALRSFRGDQPSRA